MTYLVLARKWRPRSFDTLVGQDHVVRALTHALDTQRLHHAWLFTGTRGVGKTTLSRILAKSLNCETGITSQPCGKCRACTEIDAGRFVDYLELDAASNRGVEEMTQLLEQAVYAPGAGRYKVYMIDEVHMLTGHAFNAMLKTLEEPPPHVKFILATTDPQKIPVTVLSRCLQFNLKQMPPDSIVGHLQSVLREEAIANELPALRLIAQAASGSMRDALSLTDQAIAYSAGNLTEDAVRGMLGTIDQRHLVRLLQSLAAGEAAGVLAVAEELSTRGLSYAGALADLAVLLSRVAIEQRVPGATSAEDPVAADIVRLAGLLHPDAVQLFYSVAVHSRGELSLAPDEHAGFIMACLRMLALNNQAGPQTALQAPAPAATSLPATTTASSVAMPPPNATEPSSATPQTVAATPPATAAGTDAARHADNPSTPETARYPDAQPGHEAGSAVAATATTSFSARAASAKQGALGAALPPAGESDSAPTGHGMQAAAQPVPSRDGATAAAIAPAEHPGQPAAPSPDRGASPAADLDIPPWEDLPQASGDGAAARGPHSAALAVTPATVPPQTRAAVSRFSTAAPGRSAAKPAPAAPSDVPPPETALPGDVSSDANAAGPAHADAPASSGSRAAPSRPHATRADEPPAWVDEDIPDDASGGYLPEPAYLSDPEDEFETLATTVSSDIVKATPRSPSSARRRGRHVRASLQSMTAADWPALAAKLPVTGLAAELARQSEWAGVQGDAVVLRVAVKTLAESESRVRLQTVLCEHFGQSLRLEVEVGATGDGTAHAVAQIERAERQRAAEEAVAADPFVQALQSDFGGQVRSVRAIEPGLSPG